MLVFLDRRALPDVITLILRPRGPMQIIGKETFASAANTTRLDLTWKVIELWNLPAAQLLAANDVGLVPWIPLTQFADPPETILKECRHRIDTQATPEEQENLLVVTQVLAGLRYNNVDLLKFLGGKQIMIESPLIQELIAERLHDAIEAVLVSRFKSVPAETSRCLRSVLDEDELRHLNVAAAHCASLDEFRAKLPV